MKEFFIRIISPNRIRIEIVDTSETEIGIQYHMPQILELSFDEAEALAHEMINSLRNYESH